MAHLNIHKKDKYWQKLQCLNPKCGSKRQPKYYRESTRYRAWRCGNCEHVVVEGDVGLFQEDETRINQARIDQEQNRKLNFYTGGV